MKVKNQKEKHRKDCSNNQYSASLRNVAIPNSVQLLLHTPEKKSTELYEISQFKTYFLKENLNDK